MFVPKRVQIFLGKSNFARTNVFWKMSLVGQLCHVKDDPTKKPSKFGKNHLSNSWDVTEIQFVWVVVCKVVFVSNPTYVRLIKYRMSWGCVWFLTIHIQVKQNELFWVIRHIQKLILTLTLVKVYITKCNFCYNLILRWTNIEEKSQTKINN